ncbi:sigma factor [Pygmaiobacter massiliensis]|uniref:sigma factor n=1 Tax=Pygmaiobacter massiliensis TaxID=1917873 RepID=UPI002A80785C|nr:sigma factor [Pygmaiobacter massiliensis]MDY4784392.1 sigma factor [Pygmaiobacter massiliensis]
MEKLIQEHGVLIAALADKLCRQYVCPQLREDFISAANLTLLQQAPAYDESTGASITTYLHPYLRGAMLRELERSLYPLALSKDVFQSEGALWKTNFAPLGNCREKESPTALSVDRQVLRGIYIECVKIEFERLPFRERQILGGFFGVYDYPKQTLADLAVEFQMTENALIKAKDKALSKLRLTCEGGSLGVWRNAQKQIWLAQRECGGADSATSQILWCMEEQSKS